MSFDFKQSRKLFYWKGLMGAFFFLNYIILCHYILLENNFDSFKIQKRGIQIFWAANFFPRIRLYSGKFASDVEFPLANYSWGYKDTSMSQGIVSLPWIWWAYIKCPLAIKAKQNKPRTTKRWVQMRTWAESLSHGAFWSFFHLKHLWFNRWKNTHSFNETLAKGFTL